MGEYGAPKYGKLQDTRREAEEANNLEGIQKEKDTVF